MTVQTKYCLTRDISFLYLANISPAWVNAWEISQHTGLPLSTINAKVGKWAEWGYLKRRPGGKDGKLFYEYSITAQGLNYLSKLGPRRIEFCFTTKNSNLIERIKAKRAPVVLKQGV